MVKQEPPDSQFDTMTARLLRREALRRAAEEMNTTSGPGLESVLTRISAEVTAEAHTRLKGTEQSAGECPSTSAPKCSGIAPATKI